MLLIKDVSLLQLSGFIFSNYRLPCSLIVENEPCERFQLELSSVRCFCEEGKAETLRRAMLPCFSVRVRRLGLVGSHTRPGSDHTAEAGAGGTFSVSSCSFFS